MTNLFNPETCMLMSAKDVQKKLDDQKPDMEYSSLKYKQVTNIYENCLTIKLPDDKDKE